MSKLGDYKVDKTFQVLVYGKAKVGKTFGAFSFPRPVWLDFDKGIATGVNELAVTKYGKDKLNAIEYEQFTERNMQRGIPITANAFDDACRYFDKKMKEASTFDTWVIDSGTTLFEVAMNKAIVVLGDLKISNTQKQGMQYGFKPSKMQDWGAQRDMGEQFINMVKDSGKNLVLLCHEKEQLDDEGNIIGIVPLLTGKSDEAVPLKFDEVYRIKLSRKGTDWVRVCQTKADGLSKVGTRLGVPDGIEWNYDVIMASLGRGAGDTLSGPAASASAPVAVASATRK